MLAEECFFTSHLDMFCFVTFGDSRLDNRNSFIFNPPRPWEMLLDGLHYRRGRLLWKEGTPGGPTRTRRRSPTRSAPPPAFLNWMNEQTMLKSKEFVYRPVGIITTRCTLKILCWDNNLFCRPWMQCITSPPGAFRAIKFKVQKPVALTIINYN